MYTVIETPVSISQNITTTIDDELFTNFPAEIGNPNYDQFLINTGLTDKQVHALTPNKWYDFPEGDK
jgi:hypothetical protein